MTRKQKNDEPYIDLRTQAYADKSFLGWMRLSMRTALYFSAGVLVMVALAGTYLYLDERLSKPLDRWKTAQQLSGVIGELNVAIEDVRVQDQRVRDNRDPVHRQAHRDALDRVAVLLETIQAMDDMAPVQDAVITIHDAFADYGSDFAAVLEIRRKLGETDSTGLRARRLDAARNVREVIDAYDLQTIAAEFEALDARAEVTGHAGAEVHLLAIPDAYAHLNDVIEKSAVDEAIKATVRSLLERHNTALVNLINVRMQVQPLPSAFEEILDYIGPATRAMTAWSDQQMQSAPHLFEAEHLFARQTIALASAGAILFLIAVGIIVMRSITVPLRRMAVITENLARGDRFITVPLRGNVDAIGRMARALDNWLDHLAEIDHMRVELDETRVRLAVHVAKHLANDVRQDDPHGPAREEIAGPSEEATDPSEEVTGPLVDPQVDPLAEQPVTTWEPAHATSGSASGAVSRHGREQEIALSPTVPPQPEGLPGRQLTTEAPDQRRSGLAALISLETASGTTFPSSIAAASKQITRISEYVTATAVDVERTESLVHCLADTTRQLAELEVCVAAIRDETSLVAFRSRDRLDRNSNRGTLVYLSADRDDGSKTGAVDTMRLDSIRENVTRAERLVLAVRDSLNAVTGIAHEVASTVSGEAMEATNRLLAQSEYLQNMLDDLVKRITPADQNQNAPSRHPAHRAAGDPDL